MGKLPIYILVAVILISSVNAYRYFRNGRLGKRREILKASEYEKWFTQYLDHFNPTNEQTWQQRYFVNNKLYNVSKKVAFLNIGGEGEASDTWMTGGAWYIYAQEYQPILFQLEHRYYGQSHPTKDLSTENLVYLTSQQALADLAFFIESMNKEYKLPSDVRWIIFGGSYSGSLAAWLRQKYPYLAHGAMSASGPVKAQLDFPEYMEVVQKALLSSSSKCVDAVNKSHTELEESLLTTDGQAYINKKFNLCDGIEKSLNNAFDMATFYESIADNFAGVVQYNNDNRASSLNIDSICEIMTNASEAKFIDRLAAVNTKILATNDQPCMDYKYDKTIAELSKTNWEAEAAEGSRQWLYQTCTEFGYYQTSSNVKIFGDKFKLDFFIQQCEDLFGPAFDKTFLQDAIARTNNLYGALDPEVTNVVFVHGSLDPWHVLGVTETLNSAAPAIVIEGAAHCSNMYNPSDKDTPQLTAARNQIKEIIGSWLEDSESAASIYRQSSWLILIILVGICML